MGSTGMMYGVRYAYGYVRYVQAKNVRTPYMAQTLGQGRWHD
jgi:hypothetical protein